MKNGFTAVASTIFLSFVFAQAVLSQEPEALAVIVGDTTFDIGQIERGKTKEKTFKVLNPGSTTVFIKGMEFSIPGVKARIPSTIPAKSSVDWVIEVDTKDHSGDFYAEARLVLEGKKAQQTTVFIKGRVVSAIEFDPLPAFYLSQFFGESSSQAVDIRINSQRPVELLSVESPATQARMEIERIEIGRRYILTATASPTLPVGIHSGSAFLFTDDPDRPRIRLEVNIKVKADLHPSAESVELGRLRPAVLRANPEMLEFITGSVTVESRYGKASQLAATVDLDFLEVVAEAGDDDRRLGIELRPKLDQLKPGSYTGTLTVGFAENPETTLRLPVTVVVEG